MLAGFRFSLKYRPGVGNRDAEASQRPHRQEEDPVEWVCVSEEGVQALCQGLEQEGSGRVAAEYIGVHPLAIHSRYCALTQVRGEGLPQLSRADLRQDQMEDPVGGLVVHALKSQNPELLQKIGSPRRKYYIR